jgi:hypothetical protein
MKFAHLAFLCSALCLLPSCRVQRPATVESSPPVAVIPSELVGEWRNSNDKDLYEAIYLLSDGRGLLVASDKSDVLGHKFTATYNPETHTLTFTRIPTPQLGGPQARIYEYDQKSKTILSRRAEAPFKRQSVKIPSYIMEEFE